MNTINNSGVVSNSTSSLGVSENSGGDAIGQINELMIQMGQLFGKLRDILRQYNRIQQANAFNMQVTSFNTRVDAIDTEFDAKKTQSAWQILSGGFQIVGAGVSGVGASRVGSWMVCASDVGRGAGTTTDGIVGTVTTPEMCKGQEGQALSEYQNGLASQQLKRADEALDKAIKVSADLREILTVLTQAHERLGNSVRIS